MPDGEREIHRLATSAALTGVDDNACDGGAVSTNPLGRTVHDDVRAVLNWTDQIP
jgi:hypothetical protein